MSRFMDRCITRITLVLLAFSVGRRLRDLSWEVEVDDDLAFALDRVSCDPDQAIQFLCSQSTRLQ